MSTFILIPGAGGQSRWYWHRIVPLLRAGGSDAIAVDLPGLDESAGLREYARIVTDVIGDTEDVVLVAASLGGFTAPLVASAVALRGLVLVNAMIPVPGETPGAWWADTGWEQARIAAAGRGGYPAEFDEPSYFLHDVPPEVAASGAGQQRPEAAAVFGSVCDFTAWPSVPVRVLAGADDRFFPAEFQQRVARDRLGLAVDVRPGGHLIALSQPDAVAGYLLAG